MGLMTAVGLAEQFKAGKITLKRALTIHLGANHHPPLSDKWLPVVMSIIERYETDDNLLYDVDNPVRDGKMCAEKIVERMHLEPFLPGVEITMEIIEGPPPGDPEMN